MPQRNAHNPIKSESNFGKGGGPSKETGNFHGAPTKAAGICPACKAEVPAKPGFRFSALKCPKCGGSMAKK